MEDQSEYGGRGEQVLHAERVECGIVGALEGHLHEVEDVERCCDEDDLHCCVVERDKVHKEVEVAADKDDLELVKAG